MIFPNPELPYVPPQKSAAAYAEAALRHLRTFEKLDPRLLAYLLAPSNVLALAGLRSMSPYNDAIHPDINADLFEKTLASSGLLWLDENPIVARPPLASFALINLEAADHLADTYPLPFLRDIGPVFEHSMWGFFAWATGMDISIARAMETDVLPSEWLKDWWNPHNIRFGMLLGYPGPALAAFAWAQLYEENELGLEFVEIADGEFSSPSVGFDIDKSRSRDPSVLATVDTWHKTLAKVYRAYPEKQLTANADFARNVRGNK